MIIVWRGFGILVLVVGFAAYMLAALLIDAMHLGPPMIGFAYDGMLVLAGGAVWLFADWMDAKPKQVFIDKATGREFSVGQSAGSLFFIPTRYWAFILPGLAVGLQVFEMFKT